MIHIVYTEALLNNIVANTQKLQSLFWGIFNSILLYPKITIFKHFLNDHKLCQNSPFNCTRCQRNVYVNKFSFNGDHEIFLQFDCVIRDKTRIKMKILTVFAPIRMKNVNATSPIESFPFQDGVFVFPTPSQGLVFYFLLYLVRL